MILVERHSSVLEPGGHLVVVQQTRPDVRFLCKLLQKGEEDVEELSVVGVPPSEGYTGDAIAGLQQEAEGVVVHQHTPGQVAAQQPQIFHVLSEGPGGQVAAHTELARAPDCTFCARHSDTILGPTHVNPIPICCSRFPAGHPFPFPSLLLCGPGAQPPPPSLPPPHPPASSPQPLTC